MLLGEGSFAKVYLTKVRKLSLKFLKSAKNIEISENTLFAMKVFDKQDIRLKNSKKNMLLNEIDCLREARGISGSI